MTVKVGDKVLTSKYSGTEVKVDGEECTIVPARAISWPWWKTEQFPLINKRNSSFIKGAI